MADLRRLDGRPASDVLQQVRLGPPRPAHHLVHAQLQLVILEPVRLAQQRIQHRAPR